MGLTVMRSRSTLHACIVLLLAGALVGASPSPDRQQANAAVMVPIRLMQFNTNSGKAWPDGTFAKTQTIIDEIPPFRWMGPDAAKTWWSDYGKFAAAHKLASPYLTMGTPVSRVITGDSAYIVVPATVQVIASGKRVSEQGFLTFVVVQTSYGWSIDTQIWSTTKPLH